MFLSIIDLSDFDKQWVFKSISFAIRNQRELVLRGTTVLYRLLW